MKKFTFNLYFFLTEYQQPSNRHCGHWIQKRQKIRLCWKNIASPLLWTTPISFFTMTDMAKNIEFTICVPVLTRSSAICIWQAVYFLFTSSWSCSRHAKANIPLSESRSRCFFASCKCWPWYNRYLSIPILHFPQDQSNDELHPFWLLLRGFGDVLLCWHASKVFVRA